MIRKLADYFIPIDEQRSEDDIRRSRLLVYVLLLIFASNLVFTSNHFSQPHIVFKVTLALQAAICLGLAFAFKMGMPYRLTAHLFITQEAIGLLTLCWFGGGMYSYSVYGLISAPLTALLLLGRTTGIFWFVVNALYIVLLQYIKNNGIDLMSRYQLSSNDTLYISSVLGTMNAIFVIALVFEHGKTTALNNLSQKKNELQLEKQKADELLLNILPEEVADELKKDGRMNARTYSQVSVMFADFQDFTLISQHVSAELLIQEIDHCFSAFDDIMDKYQIEKIKTVGDCYMCASGLPHVIYNHAGQCVQAAIEIIKFMEKRKQEQLAKGKISFNIRIGIHSGPVIAGIVGKKKFAYDIWGDTVNVAARMESSSEAGKINISGSTFQLIKDNFKCSYRGKIAAKNTGDIEMYFVES